MPDKAVATPSHIIHLADERLFLTFTDRGVDPPPGVHAILGQELPDRLEFDFEHDRIVIHEKTLIDKSSGGGFGPTMPPGLPGRIRGASPCDRAFMHRKPVTPLHLSPNLCPAHPTSLHASRENGQILPNDYNSGNGMLPFLKTRGID